MATRAVSVEDVKTGDSADAVYEHPFIIRLTHWVNAVALFVMVLLQWNFFRFLIRQRGVAFAAASVPLFLAHSLAGAIGFGVGLLMRPKR